MIWCQLTEFLRGLVRPDYKASSVKCSFCQSDVPNGFGEGVWGIQVYICKNCVAKSVEMIASQDPAWRNEQLGSLTSSTPNPLRDDS